MTLLSYFSTYRFYILELLLNTENKTKQLSLSALLGKSTKYIRQFLRKTVNFDELFLKLICILNIDLAEGFFIIDGTDYSKPFFRMLKAVATLFIVSNKSYSKGYEIVLLCWSNNKITLPISFKIRHINYGKTQVDIAIDLIKYAREISKDKNLGFRVDAFFNAKKVLGYLHKNHIFFYTRFGRGRIFFVNGKEGHPECQKQLYEWFAQRWNIECVFRFCKSELKLLDCQGFDLIQHYNHIGYCFFAYALLQASFPSINPYKAKRRVQSMWLKKSVSLKPQAKQLCA